jgi:hypothetical protein
MFGFGRVDLITQAEDEKSLKELKELLSKVPKRPPARGWTQEEGEAHGKLMVEALKEGLRRKGVKEPAQRHRELRSEKAMGPRKEVVEWDLDLPYPIPEERIYTGPPSLGEGTGPDPSEGEYSIGGE